MGLGQAKMRAGWFALAAVVVQGCAGDGGPVGGLSNLDWDLRNNGGSTAGAARSAAGRPSPDANGIISYPGYQVAVARGGDTVGTVATRVGIAPDQLARFNALSPNDTLREGEILALPVRVAASPAALPGATPGVPVGGIEVSSIATTTIDGAPVASSTTAAPKAPFATTGSGPVPVRYQVKRGETAFTIARQFNIQAKALADWNGLPSDLSVREGQYLIIPTAADLARRPTTETLPGQGSPTPLPPSASEALPDEKTVTAAQAAQTGQSAPDLGSQRTSASAAQMAMPLDGKIIRGYDGKSNQGIDISGTAGAAVTAAAAGTVAVVTTDAGSGATIVILKHDGGLLTVYAGLDAPSVTKGATVTRGQKLGGLRPANPATLHFEVRQGQQSIDPLTYLQ